MCMDIRGFLKKINPNEFAFDCAILLFPFLLEEIYDPLMESAPLGIPFARLFVAGTVYFLPLLIGTMYNRDFANSPGTVRKIVPVVLFASMFFAYANLLYMIVPGMNAADSGNGPFVMVSATLFLVMGPTAGLYFTRKGAPGIEGASTQLVIFLITVGFLPMLYLLIAGERIFGDTGFLLGMLIVLLVIAGDAVFIVLVLAAYRTAKNLLARAGLYDASVRAVRIATPFCVSFMLVFFNIMSDRLFTGIGLGGACAVVLILVLYVVSGVLPLRLVMMLTPPVKPLNAALGVLSAASMITVLIMR